MVTDHGVFDRGLPSPLETVSALRCSGEDSVVPTGRSTGRQESMYVATGLEERLVERMLLPDRPALLVLSGSAGGGKSALIRRLEQLLPDGTFSQVIEDATHAEAPDQDQIRLLAGALGGFRAGVPDPATCVLLAANTGLLLRLQRKFRAARERGLAELVAYLLHRLGVPAAPPVEASRRAALDGCVIVVDLDQRPTSGGEDRLLRRMLRLLDPRDPDGILAGARRCETCQVRQYCAPRTNLELLADDTVGRVLDAAVEQVALIRGRDIAPRQLWDGVADLALGGIVTPASGDPCDAIATIAASANKAAVWQALLPVGPFSRDSSKSVLVRDLAAIDPSFQPGAEAHEIIAAAGIDPAADAEQLLGTLGADGDARMAVTTAADALGEEDLLPREVARGLIRARWLRGYLAHGEAVPRSFLDATRDDPDAAREIIDRAGQGLVRAFGHTADGADYLPTEGLSESRSARVLARLDLSAGGQIDLRPPLALERNPSGSAIVGARPLAARLVIGQTELTLDYGLFRLLEAAASGTVAATIDIERFHALRHAAETLGRQLGDGDAASLLVVPAGASASYRVSKVTFRSKPELRVTKVG